MPLGYTIWFDQADKGCTALLLTRNAHACRYNAATKAVRALALKEGAKNAKNNGDEDDEKSKKGSGFSLFAGSGMKNATKELSDATAALAAMESNYLQKLSSIFNRKQREAFDKLVATGQWTLADGPWNTPEALAPMGTDGKWPMDVLSRRQTCNAVLSA